MISVKCEYINAKGKTNNDYFIYTNIEVSGHAERIGHTTGIKVCAGVSACCVGIRRLLDDEQFKSVYEKGYCHIWVERTKNLRQCLDKDSVHALNTLVCQLYEIYCEYPTAFKEFELVDVKENYDGKQQTNKRFRKPRKKRMGLYSLIEGSHSQEN